MENNKRFWEKQKQLYLKQKYKSEIRYEAWQPGRWAANRSAIQVLDPYLSNIKSSCEVGAGSAAFSFELKRRYGLDIIGIDLCRNAKEYAEIIANDMKLSIDYRVEDLFLSSVKADLILSLGVIEHFGKEQQIAFLKKCSTMANKYVLVAIPNQDSPIFRNYVRWANKGNQSYEEEHKPLTTESLCQMCEGIGMKIIHKDGFQVFLSEVQFWNNTDLNKIPLYSKLKVNMKDMNNRWREFPYFDFTYADIPDMVKLETSLSCEERLNNGFMTYVLAEKG